MHIRLPTGYLVSELFVPHSPPCACSPTLGHQEGLGVKVGICVGGQQYEMPSFSYNTGRESAWEMRPVSAAAWRASLLWGSPCYFKICISEALETDTI